ncbi:MAG: VCBS repeat-containing protein [Planctomycetota bacterium]
MTRTEVVETSFGGEIPLAIETTIPGFDTQGDTRLLLDVQIEIDVTLSALIIAENLGLEPAAVAADFQGSVAGNVASEPTACETGLDEPIVEIAGGSDGFNGMGPDFVEFGTLFLQCSEQSNVVTNDDSAQSIWTAPTLNVTFQGTGQAAAVGGAPLAIGVLDMSWSVALRVTYTYRDTLVQPLTQRQQFTVETPPDGTITPIIIAPFDDVNGSRELVEVRWDNTHGTRADFSLTQPIAEVSAPFTLQAITTQSLTSPTINQMWTSDRTLALPSINENTTEDIGEQNLVTRTITSITDPAALVAFDSGMNVDAEVTATNMLSASEPTIEIDAQNLTATSEITLDYIYNETENPLGTPDFSQAIDGAILQASGAFGGLTGTDDETFDDVAVVVEGTPDEVVILLGQGVNGSGMLNDFNVEQVLQIGTGSSAIITADLDGDTFDDIVVTTEADDTVWVILNDGTGNGTFDAPLQIPLTANDGPVDVTVADFNGDSTLDLAVANGGTETVRVLIGTPGDPGSFGSGPTIDVPDPGDIEPSDVDEDKDIDIIVLSLANEEIVIIESDGGGFTPVDALMTGSLPATIDVVDLNNDDADDILVTNEGDSSFWYYQSAAQAGSPPAYDAPFVVTTENGAPIDAVTGDFDADGDQDVAVTISQFSVAVDRVDVYETDFENDTVVLRPPFTAGVLNEGSTLITGDFNGDTVDDLAVLDTVGGGGGGEESGINGPSTSNEVIVFNGIAAPVCIADITPVPGNNEVNIDDLIAVINAFGPCPIGPPCVTDITPAGGNGETNVDDLIAVINAFGPCP